MRYYKFLVLPPYNVSQAISRYFGNAVKVASTYDEKVHDIIRDRKQSKNNSAVYRSSCDRPTLVRRDYHKTSNSMVVHVDEGNLPNWKDIEIIHERLNKQKR